MKKIPLYEANNEIAAEMADVLTDIFQNNDKFAYCMDNIEVKGKKIKITTTGMMAGVKDKKNPEKNGTDVIDRYLVGKGIDLSKQYGNMGSATITIIASKEQLAKLPVDTLNEQKGRQDIIDELNRLEKEQIKAEVDMYDKKLSDAESEAARKVYNRTVTAMRKIRKGNKELYTAWKNAPFSSKGRQPEMNEGIEDKYEKAAAILSKKIPASAKIDDMEGFKYGAYSYESWEEVAAAMKAAGVDLSSEVNTTTWLDDISDFVDELKKKKLMHLEW